MKFLLWRTGTIRSDRHTSDDWDREYASGTWKRLEAIDEILTELLQQGFSFDGGLRLFLQARRGFELGCGIVDPHHARAAARHP